MPGQPNLSEILHPIGIGDGSDRVIFAFRGQELEMMRYWARQRVFEGARDKVICDASSERLVSGDAVSEHQVPYGNFEKFEPGISFELRLKDIAMMATLGVQAAISEELGHTATPLAVQIAEIDQEEKIVTYHIFAGSTAD